MKMRRICSILPVLVFVLVCGSSAFANAPIESSASSKYQYGDIIESELVQFDEKGFDENDDPLNGDQELLGPVKLLSSLSISGNGGPAMIRNYETITKYHFTQQLCQLYNATAIGSGEAGLCYYDPSIGGYRYATSASLPRPGFSAYFGTSNLNTYDTYTWFFEGTWTQGGMIYFYDYQW